MSAMADGVMKHEGDTYIVNTTTLCKTKGYKGTTPLEVHIKGGKVVKIVALPNVESKGYYARVQKGVFPKYIGLKVSKAKKKAASTQVDGVTGATYSSRAVQANINAALEYYEAHK